MPAAGPATPTRSSAATNAFIALLSLGRDIRPRPAAALVMFCFAVATAVDATSGGVLNPFLPYIITCFIAGWCLGEMAGMASVVASVTALNWLHGGAFGQLRPDVHVGPLAMAWNVVARALVMGLFALTASALRTVVDRERWRASVDGLTGALNKVAFREQAGELLPEVRRRDGAIVLAYMDLDGFKGVNDRHGHSAGDRVLTAFAAGAAAAIRSYDLFARIGGDEFVALLAVRTCSEGDQVAAMLHERLTAVLRETGFRVTCSMGALVARAAEVTDGDGLIEAADKLMYEVKRSGKNSLRIGRSDPIGPILREAYPLPDSDPMQPFIDLIQPVERRAAA